MRCLQYLGNNLKYIYISVPLSDVSNISHAILSESEPYIIQIHCIYIFDDKDIPLLDVSTLSMDNV